MTLIRLRRRVSSEPSLILQAGEPAVDVEAGVLKIGNGTDTWAGLPAIGALSIGDVAAALIAGENVELDYDAEASTITISATGSAGGVDGKSAYQLAVEAGFTGTLAEWLTSLHGTDGTDGIDGSDGLSAELRMSGGNLEWRQVGGDWATLTSLASITGPAGADGTDGTNGVDGDDGAPGVGVPVGGSAGQILRKASETNYDTEWATPSSGGTGGAVDSVNGQDGVVVLDAGDVGAVPAAEKGAANGVATLGSDGKLTGGQIPPIAVVDFLGAAANQAAMLALVGQKGDWAIRTDLATVWVIKGSDPSVLAGWQELSYPTAPVTTVAGKTGAVVLAKGDVGLGNVDNTSDTAKPISTATQAALNTKASLASPALTGNPTAPTPSAGDSDTSIATTEFVNTNLRLPLAVTALPGSPVAGQIYLIVPTL